MNRAAGVNFAEIVGPEHVITDEAERRYFSTDLSWLPMEVAAVVVQPGTVDELTAVIQRAYGAELPIVARGGGTSYTRGYTPSRPDSVLVDTRRLDRIPEINLRDGYVVVEGGCTWEKLWSRLGDHGARTPFWGVGAGRHATVGGTLAQNAILLGSSKYNSLADCTLGLEVVVGHGELLRTGSWARSPGSPFSRHFGPDLTGLFIGDTGALGVIARASLALIPKPTVVKGAAFSFRGLEAAVDTMKEMAGQRLACEVYGKQPVGDIMASNEEDEWVINFVVEGLDEGVVDRSMAVLRGIARHRGSEIAGATPQQRHQDPFGDVHLRLLGNDGQVTLPTNAMIPFSKARELIAEFRALLRQRRAVIQQHGLLNVLWMFVVGKDFAVDLFTFWHDELGRFRLECIDEEHARMWGGKRANPESRRAAVELRQEIVDLLSRIGATNIQIGKYYAYREVLHPRSLELVKAVKASLDPKGLYNPGELGL